MSEKQVQDNQFAIQKLYVKDISFESPAAPAAFGFKKWEPKIDINLNNAHSVVGENQYEAVLTITATVKHEDKAAFLVEVQQAGIFSITGFNEQDRNYLLASQCMNILFPYAREVISDLTARGGYPPLILAPVNFDALYQQHVLKNKEKQEEQKEEQQEEKQKTEDQKH